MAKVFQVKSLVHFFTLSVLLHVFALIISTILNSQWNKTQALKPSAPISLEVIEVKPKEALSKKQDVKKGHIVDQERINNELDPNAKYLSSHNQKVIKETVARNHGQFQNIKKAVEKPSEKKKTIAESQVKKNIPVAHPKQASLQQDLFGSYKKSLDRALEQQVNHQKNEKTGASAPTEMSQTRDYLPGKEAGMETLLSTREFVYYTYYNRIRNQLSEYWEPKIKQKVLNMFKQGRRIASTEDHITKVQIVLDAKGILMKVQVLGASGVQDLDEVAVEAFRAAAPFPNPPKGIIESDGTVKIEWDFVVES